jgi:CheY-like chemotaxis protein
MFQPWASHLNVLAHGFLSFRPVGQPNTIPFRPMYRDLALLLPKVRQKELMMQSPDLPRILVVDDNRDNANIIRQYLEAVCGYPITVAYDGDEALRAFETEHPSIVLLDVMMPGRDGWDVCRTMKQHANGTQVRVIMVTALDDISDKCQALQTGADDFVEKPFDLTRLAASVYRNLAALNQSQARSSAA